MFKRKIWLKIAANLALAAGFCLLRFKDGFDGELAFGLYVGALYCEALILPSLTFIASGLLGGLNSFYVALAQVAVMVAASLIHIKTKRKISRWLLLLYVAAANVFYVLYGIDTQLIASRLINAAVGIIFAYVCVYALRALFVRGLKYQAGADECVCIYIVLLALLKGLANISYFGVNTLNLLAPFLILSTLFTLGSKSAFCLAATFGLAFALTYGDLTMLAVCCLWTAFAVAFYTVHRILAVLSLLLCEVILAYFFEVYALNTTPTLICTLIGCAFFCLIPTWVLRRVSASMGNDKTQYSPRHIINRLRVNLSRRLFDLSEVFFAMQNTFKSLTRGVLPPEKAVYAIGNEVTDNACKDCPQKLKCWRADASSTQTYLHQLIGCGIDRGKVTLLDLPPEMANKCLRVSTMLSITNTEVANYKQYYLINSSFDNSRALLGSVTGGISKVMLSLSRDSQSTLSFDSAKEKQLMEQLTFFNVLVKEAVILSREGELSITLIVDKKDADKPQIADVLFHVCGVRFVCRAKENSLVDDWTVLYYSPKPRYDLSVGLAAVTKKGSEISGDTHSFIRLADDKYLLALCDGMGSGVQAERASATAISLVESFYRAGFDNDLILNCINKLLTAASSEVFTAVDVCVTDLKNGATDFIKLGAPSGLVKNDFKVQFVEGACLPLGVLEEIKPSITKKVLGEGDFILLASDGFWDSFSDKTIPAKMFTECSLTNPQIIAQNLVEQALAQNNGTAKDDITVLVAKIF